MFGRVCPQATKQAMTLDKGTLVLIWYGGSLSNSSSWGTRYCSTLQKRCLADITMRQHAPDGLGKVIGAALVEMTKFADRPSSEPIVIPEFLSLLVA